jgi:hypothetical protein
MLNGALIPQTPSSGVLTITGATSSNVGNYVCRATNEWGTAISNTIDLQLAYITEFTDRSTTAISPTGGNGGVMVCRGKPQSAPTALYRWSNFRQTTDSATSGVEINTDARLQIDQATGTRTIRY